MCNVSNGFKIEKLENVVLMSWSNCIVLLFGISIENADYSVQMFCLPHYVLLYVLQSSRFKYTQLMNVFTYTW